MENLKFNVGDNVKIVSNDLQPAMVGKIGRVKKVYPSFSEYSDNMFSLLTFIALKLEELF